MEEIVERVLKARKVFIPKHLKSKKFVSGRGWRYRARAVERDEVKEEINESALGFLGAGAILLGKMVYDKWKEKTLNKIQPTLSYHGPTKTFTGNVREHIFKAEKETKVFKTLVAKGGYSPEKAQAYIDKLKAPQENSEQITQHQAYAQHFSKKEQEQLKKHVEAAKGFRRAARKLTHVGVKDSKTEKHVGSVEREYKGGDGKDALVRAKKYRAAAKNHMKKARELKRKMNPSSNDLARQYRKRATDLGRRNIDIRKGKGRPPVHQEIEISGPKARTAQEWNKRAGALAKARKTQPPVLDIEGTKYNKGLDRLEIKRNQKLMNTYRDAARFHREKAKEKKNDQ